MTTTEVDECLRLLGAGTHDVIVKPLSMVTPNGHAPADHVSRRRSTDDSQGNCEVELWRSPRPRNERAELERVMEATHEEAKLLISHGAADQRNHGG